MKLMSSRILVTGGAGFVGSAFIRHLLSQRAFEGSILNVDLLTSGRDLSAVETAQDDPRYRYVQGDVRDTQLMASIYQETPFDLIVHFASDPTEAVSTDLLGTMQLLEFARKRPVHLHVASTQEKLGMKSIAEHAVRRASGVSASISCSAPCFGPYQRTSTFIPSLILSCMNKKPFRVPSNASACWLDVEDCAALLTRALQSPQEGAAYLLTGREEKSDLDLAYDLIDEMANVVGVDSQLFVDLMQIDGGVERHAQETEAAGLIHLEADVDLQNSIYHTIQWYLSAREWTQKAQNWFAFTP